MFGYDNLMNHYQTNFSLMQHHKYSLTELEHMIPWERHMYVDMLKDFLRAKEEAEKERANKLKNARNAEIRRRR
jgi:hypothetical protein